MLVLREPTSPIVRECWERSHRLGVAAETEGYPVVASSADLSWRRERLTDVLREERQLLSPTSLGLGGGPLVAVVADRDGVILSARADRALTPPMARVRLVEGAFWGEETRGTNAIGTALVEGRPVGVIGSAHYETRNKDLFCYASPVRDAYGDIVAVIDVSGPMNGHDPAIALAVQAAALSVEAAIHSAAYGGTAGGNGGTFAAIERLVQRSAEPTVLVDATGKLRVMNRQARELLGSALGGPSSCMHLFGVGFDALLAAAEQPGGVRFEAATLACTLVVDPILGPTGRPISAVVHFEVERPRKLSAPPRDLAQVAAPPASADPAFDAVLGTDASLRDAKAMATRFAKTELPVLLLGETGVGKELFARAIHEASGRKRGPFVAVNCGGLPPTLIASELFGYAPSAFTGASRSGAEGRIAAANGGTLFLDEIAEMPADLQAALLRVLENGAYQRVGETRERRAQFRLVSATCRALPELVAEERFRKDLFYRVNGATVTVPKLSCRTDVVWLAERLLEELAPGDGVMLGPDARAWLGEHDWPGNVRELRNALVHALAMRGEGGPLERTHFPRATATARHAAPPPSTRRGILQAAIEATLTSCEGNVSEAARRLGVGRATIYRAVRKPGAD